MYDNVELKRIVECYKKSGGDMTITRHLYDQLYGKMPSAYIVRKAIKFEKNLKNNQDTTSRNMDDPTENLKSIEDSTTFKIKEEVKDTNNLITVKKETIWDLEDFPMDEDSIMDKDSAMDEDFKLNKLDFKLHQCPIVYTTRLDHMNIFKRDFNSMRAETIIDNILLESKPKFYNLAKYKEFEDLNSFSELSDKVKEYNHVTTYVDFGGDALEVDPFFVKEENSLEKAYLSERSKKLSELCTPLSIMLTDIKNYADILIKIHEISESIPPNIGLDFNYKFLIIEDLYLNSTDIFFHENGVTTYYYLMNYIPKKICDFPFYKYLLNHKNGAERKVYKIKNCCWHKREKNIKFISTKYLRDKCTSLIQKPHSCASDECVCCCSKVKTKRVKIKKEDKDVEPSIPNILNNESERLQRLNTNKTGVNTWLIKALEHTKKNTHGYCRPPIPKIRLESYTIAFCASELATGQDEHKINVRHMPTERYEFHTGDIINSYMRSPQVKTVDTVTCCWKKRNSDISRLCLQRHMKNFMSQSQIYPNGTEPCPFCVSKPIKPSTILQLKEMTLPERTEHTKNYFSQNALSWRTSKYATYPIRNLEKSVKKLTARPAKRSVKTITTEQSSFKVPVVPPQLRQLPTESVLSTDPTVSTLISSILERFKDIKLSINMEGKVFAELNTGIDTLSTEELKVLSNILNRVQEQVNSLGLSSNNSGVQTVLDPQNTSPNLLPVVNNNLLTVAPNLGGYNNNSIHAQTDTSVPNTTRELRSEINSDTPNILNFNTNIVPPSLPNFPLLGNHYSTKFASTEISKAPTDIPKTRTPRSQNLRNVLFYRLETELNASSNQYECYKKLMMWKYQQYKESFKSFISAEKTFTDAPSIENTPRIENVFSLSGVVDKEKQKSDALIDLTAAKSAENPQPGPSGVRSGIKRASANSDEQSNKKLKIRPLVDLTIDSPDLEPPSLMLTPAQVLINRSPLLTQQMQATMLGDNIMKPVPQPLIINNPGMFESQAQAINNFVHMSSQLPPLIPFHTPVIITNNANFPVATPDKADDECILGV